MKFKLATAAAAVLMSATASQAADLAKKAPVAVDYVKVCDAYGAGFFYIPGTDTCLKIGGYVRTQAWGGDGDAGPFFGSRSDASYRTMGRIDLQVDARSQTEFGILRSFGQINIDARSQRSGANWDNNGFENKIDKAFIQWAGFTLGYATSMWDFFTGYTMQLEYGSAEHDDSRNLAAYTFGFGNGVSATISVEDATYNSRTSNTTYSANTTYGGVKAPDIIGKINIDQAWGAAQLMAVAHHNYSLAAGGIDDWGYAVGAGVKINTPMFGAGDQIALQVVYADGASTYTGSNLADWDANYDTNASWSIEGGFKHVFSPAVSLLVDGAYLSNDTNVSGLIDSRWDASVALAWTPVTNLTFTGEVEYRSIDYVNAGSADGWVFGVRAQRNF